MASNQIYLILFWTVSVGLIIFALAFWVPFVYFKKRKWIGSGVFFLSVGILFYYFGQFWSFQKIAEYYHPDEISLRTKADSIRTLILNIEKKEFQVQLRLKENPEDKEAARHLLSLWGIKSYYNRDYTQARQYFEMVLKSLPNEASHEEERQKIQAFIERLG